MAMAIPQTRAELDALKSNITAGVGSAATQVKQRNPLIQAAYDQVAAQIRSDATARSGRDAEATRQNQAGMASAAQDLGVQPVSLGANSRSARLSKVLSDQYNGDAGAWGSYLGTMKGTAVGRNNAAADTFTEQGRVMNSEFEQQFAEYLAMLNSGGGGGGGGRGGGTNYEDEPLLSFPKSVAPMTEGVARGLAATSRRLTAQGEAGMPKNYKYLGHESAGSGRRPAGRRGSGGTF